MATPLHDLLGNIRMVHYVVFAREGTQAIGCALIHDWSAYQHWLETDTGPGARAEIITPEVFAKLTKMMGIMADSRATAIATMGGTK